MTTTMARVALSSKGRQGWNAIVESTYGVTLKATKRPPQARVVTRRGREKRSRKVEADAGDEY